MITRNTPTKGLKKALRELCEQHEKYQLDYITAASDENATRMAETSAYANAYKEAVFKLCLASGLYCHMKPVTVSCRNRHHHYIKLEVY